MKMVVIFYLLLMLRVGRCTDDHVFETTTVEVGDDVTLNCTRQTSALRETLFWIRLVTGKTPEFLGGTYAFDYEGVNKTARITAKQEPGSFILHIHDTKLSDTGLYYCLKVKQLNMTFSKSTLLRVKGPEPDITAVTQDPSDPVRPGDSVTLQCSVLSDSEKKTCPEEHRVYWFRAASDESHPSFIYAQGNSSDGCEKSPEAHSPQKCIYSFSKDVSSSDAGTYYCAVATCGEILFGNGAKLDFEGASTCSQDADAVIFLLCAVLAISLIVVAVLIYAMKKKENDCYSAAVAVQRNSGGRKSQQRDVDTQVYSAVVFTVMKTGSGAIKDSRAAERQRIYAAVKAFGLD
ncbi:signal-regulatory protein beta-2-like isoform X2 [Epinephelus fuscoguttatus]|uniref:signal-regulatory protein beta-2-like isoform X2 n=1 Tax=Epinephelus fuscoguttatus TaxID=293821 RepID=UPI0020D1B133|nr:signal-regulatory protein beta-2-like isoform X2 [Epinephelus fuscoguttatus]